jgi:hypothetical protein
MKSSDILEIKCILGYILLECLSSHAQKYYKKIRNPIENNRSIKKNKILEEISKKYNISDADLIKMKNEFINQFPSLQDSILRIQRDFKIINPSNINEIFRLRNKYIHRGISVKKGQNQTKFTYELMYFIDNLLLGILGYNGPLTFIHRNINR